MKSRVNRARGRLAQLVDFEPSSGGRRAHPHGGEPPKICA